ncbi:hypothetical protein ACX80U_05770 [Arthrobacter sp. TmT3-37]
MPSIDTQVPAIEAWETEDGNIVVWGTHDPKIAEATSSAFWEQSGHPAWAHPSLRTEEEWSKDLRGTSEQPGWTPYLVFWA